MQMLSRPRIAIALGAFLVVMLAILGGRMNGPALVGQMAAQAPVVIAEAGGSAAVTARFASPNGLPTRHPVLFGGEPLDEATRLQIARAIAAIPGVGGIHWSDGGMLAESGAASFSPMHCQEDVQALLNARTIRFEESSARIDASSRSLVSEVAAALQPCLGAIIGITGHTDSSGSEVANLALSRERAEAVRAALMMQGIPADGLRVEGRGSSEPVEGLDPTDPANRRIDFTVLETEPVSPTPIDTPGPR